MTLNTVLLRIQPLLVTFVREYATMIDRKGSETTAGGMGMCAALSEQRHDEPCSTFECVISGD